MPEPRRQAIERLESAVAELGDLADRLTLVGGRGFTDSLYGMVPGHGDVRGRVEIVRARFGQLADFL